MLFAHLGMRSPERMSLLPYRSHNIPFRHPASGHRPQRAKLSSYNSSAGWRAIARNTLIMLQVLRFAVRLQSATTVHRSRSAPAATPPFPAGEGEPSSDEFEERPVLG